MGRRKTSRKTSRKTRKVRLARRGGSVNPKKEIQNAIDIATEKRGSIDRNTYDRIQVGRDISNAIEKAKGAYEGNPVMWQAVDRMVEDAKRAEDVMERQTGRDMFDSLSDMIFWLEVFKMKV